MNNLKKLRDIQPNAEWKTSTRALFASREESVALGLPVFAITFGGFMLFVVAIANAALVSMPGESLYTVKRGLEKAQTSLSLNETQRSRLELEFVGRRVDELKQIGHMSDQSAGLTIATQEALSTVQSAQRQLRDIAQRAGSLPQSQKKEIAQILEDKTQEVHKAVIDLPQSLKSDILRVLGEANGNNDTTGTTTPSKEIKDMIEAKDSKQEPPPDSVFQAPTSITNPHSNSRFQQ